MCGIVGYVGNKDVIPILLEGLHSLEYRGYDSSGIAVHEGSLLKVIKSAGKISKLEEILSKDGNSNGNGKTCGIGHTRWATHGEPTDINAHPHFDSDEKVAVVHNGIIRNYQEVKDKLIVEGIKFSSDTDTEVIVQLVSNYLKETGSILNAIRKTVSELEGSYALAVLFKSESGKIFGVRKESPLVVGFGDKENYLASDSPALSQFVDRIVRLGDGEIAEVTKDKVEFYNFEGKKLNKKAQIITKSKDIMDKRGYKHYLAKEISEQADVVSHLLNDFLPSPSKKVQFDHLKFENKFVKNIDRILVLACGTAYHAGLVGKYVIENIAGIPVEVQLASEFLSTKALLTTRSLVIGISQSGETADTLAAIRKAKSSGATLLGITNRADSALADLSKNHLIISNAGLEVSVCATKTFIAQLTVLYLLAIHFSEILNAPALKGRGSLCHAERQHSALSAIKRELRMMPQLIDQTITRGELYQEQVIKYAEKPDFVFIGRGINYPIALEAALKLKELSYIHASGYAAGEMKHGPIAVLDSEVPVVSIIVPGETYDRVFQNSIEAKARQAPMIAVAVDGDKKIENVFDTVLHVPSVNEILSPFLTVIPMQFLAYYIAEHLGCDIDQPRNLAKSVTVE